MPAGCADCNAAGPGIAPELAPPLPIEFPEGVTSDVQAWQRLTSDAALLDADLALLRKMKRRTYAQEPRPKVDAVHGDATPRAKSVVLVTDELVARVVALTNAIVKVQDAKTKTMRAVAELARLHRRDLRTKQLLAAKLEKMRGKTGAGRKK